MLTQSLNTWKWLQKNRKMSYDFVNLSKRKFFNQNIFVQQVSKMLSPIFDTQMWSTVFMVTGHTACQQADSTVFSSVLSSKWFVYLLKFNLQKKMKIFTSWLKKSKVSYVLTLLCTFHYQSVSSIQDQQTVIYDNMKNDLKTQPCIKYIQ